MTIETSNQQRTLNHDDERFSGAERSLTFNSRSQDGQNLLVVGVFDITCIQFSATTLSNCSESRWVLTLEVSSVLEYASEAEIVAASLLREEGRPHHERASVRDGLEERLHLCLHRSEVGLSLDDGLELDEDCPRMKSV